MSDYESGPDAWEPAGRVDSEASMLGCVLPSALGGVAWAIWLMTDWNLLTAFWTQAAMFSLVVFSLLTATTLLRLKRLKVPLGRAVWRGLLRHLPTAIVGAIVAVFAFGSRFGGLIV